MQSESIVIILTIHILYKSKSFLSFFCYFLKTILLFLVVLAFTYIIPRASENTLVDDDKLCNYRAICMYFMFFLLASGVVSFDSSWLSVVVAAYISLARYGTTYGSLYLRPDSLADVGCWLAAIRCWDQTLSEAIKLKISC